MLAEASIVDLIAEEIEPAPFRLRASGEEIGVYGEERIAAARKLGGNILRRLREAGLMGRPFAATPLTETRFGAPVDTIEA